MSIDTYLRLMVQADKEAKITKVKLTGPAAQQFTSQLTSGQTRKSLMVYNKSDSASGEAYFGYSSTLSPSGESSVIPVGSLVTLPISTDLSVYFCPSSGEISDIRVEELA